MTITKVISAGTLVAIDTSPFIYYIEGNSDYDQEIVEFFDICLDTGRNPSMTTVVTLSEVLVGAIRARQFGLVDRYRDILLHSEHLSVLSLTPEIAERAAELRAEYSPRLPDALQFAAALNASASYFLTNDDAFRRVSGINGLSVLVLSQIS